MTILNVRHRTTYWYRQPVEFGEHRLMCRPRDSHDLRLITTTLSIEPGASSVRWLHDVFGNSIAIATFDRPASRLTFESGFRGEHYPTEPRQILVEPYAGRIPFTYTADDATDLAGTAEPHYADPRRRLHEWAIALAQRTRDARTLDVLEALTTGIKAQFRYVARDEAGVQSPLETLERGTGSCRDFALLMMEAARGLGLAARFVSGYLYDERLIGAGSGLVGGGTTHAWLQVFLPGAGWIEFDPTNGLVGGRNLIRVAVARDPSQAAPLVGRFKGGTDAFMSMSVEVSVTTE
jgi:transglutaminase-like putative cysteine protease